MCWDNLDDSTVLPISRYRHLKCRTAALHGSGSSPTIYYWRLALPVSLLSLSTSKQLQNMRNSPPDQNLIQRTLLSENLISTGFPLDLGEKHRSTSRQICHKSPNTGKRLTGWCWERSNSANSYRAEMLGLCSLYLLAQALSELQDFQVGDNNKTKGALECSSYQLPRIKPSAKSADIRRSFRSTKLGLKGKLIY